MLAHAIRNTCIPMLLVESGTIYTNERKQQNSHIFIFYVTNEFLVNLLFNSVAHDGEYVSYCLTAKTTVLWMSRDSAILGRLKT